MPSERTTLCFTHNVRLDNVYSIPGLNLGCNKSAAYWKIGGLSSAFYVVFRTFVAAHVYLCL
jgi:hypothetical protein